jgi:hypothetical protein
VHCTALHNCTELASVFSNSDNINNATVHYYRSILTACLVLFPQHLLLAPGHRITTPRPSSSQLIKLLVTTGPMSNEESVIITAVKRSACDMLFPNSYCTTRCFQTFEIFLIRQLKSLNFFRWNNLEFGIFS